MATLSNRQTLLRWMFLGMGLLLLFGGNVVFQTISQNVAEDLFPDRPAQQRLLVNICATINLAGAILSLITAWGLKRQRRWARWCGIGASLFLLVLFPLGTLPGMIGLQQLISRAPDGAAKASSDAERLALARKSKDTWIAGKYSRPQRFVLGILGVGSLITLSAVGPYARHLSMTGWNLGWIFLPLLLLIDVMVHELGHVAMAWALHNRLRTVNIGPFTFCDFGRGKQFHFDWRRLFHVGGFVSSAPASGANLRLKFIAEVAGGPAAAFLHALIMAALFFVLPGTRFQAIWWFPGFLAVIAFSDAVANLVPLGYSDGSMIFHLTLLTGRGRALLLRCAVNRSREDSGELHDHAEFGKAVELWEATLRSALKDGEGNAFVIALCHQHLARSRFSWGDWAGAEAACRACLAFEAECAFEDALKVNSWALLERSAFARHRVLEVGRAYPQVLTALEERKNKIGDRIESCVASIMLGRAHIAAADFNKALEEARAALAILTPGRERMVLCSEAWSIRAQAELALGHQQSWVESARQAAELLRSTELPPGRRTNACHDLAQLGEDLWWQGESRTALDLIREGITGLESVGASHAAAQHRIRLASCYRETRDSMQAWECLPDEDGLPVVRLRELLAEKARLYLATGRPDAAAAEGQRLLAMWEAEPLERAVVQGLLAEAALDSSDFIGSATLARQAFDVLSPAWHYERAAALLTLAIAEWKAGGEWNQARVNEAQNFIQQDLLLGRAAKDRLLQTQAMRLTVCRGALESETALAHSARSIVERHALHGHL